MYKALAFQKVLVRSNVCSGPAFHFHGAMSCFLLLHNRGYNCWAYIDSARSHKTTGLLSLFLILFLVLDCHADFTFLELGLMAFSIDLFFQRNDKYSMFET